MAEHNAHADGHPAMDYAEHEKTFGLFMGLVKYVSIGAVIVLIGMAFFLL